MSIERLDPSTTGDICNRDLHVERYEWAAARVEGREVLDIACGVGYGSAMLARAKSPARVLGVDRSQEAVDVARARHASDRVTFARIDDAATASFERRFDTVVSLETIEHLSEPGKFLRRVHGWLNPGGRLILSAPVRESPGENAFHLQCFTADTLRAAVRGGFVVEEELLQFDGHYLTVSARRIDSNAPAASGKPVVLAYCERLDNESSCVAVLRELGAYYDVRPFGPGWPTERLDQVDAGGARFYLELDAVTGQFHHPFGLERLSVPKFAWLVDTHKKPTFHQAIAREMDLTFYAMKTWAHLFEGNAAWLPLHCDTAIFKPVAAKRDLDIAFVGSQPWRADPIERIGKRHGLRVHVAHTTGSRLKTETAHIYARSKLVFNRHVANDLNFRVFEAMACARVLLTDAQANGQYDLFEDGRHYVLYKDERDLEALVLRYLADDPARERIEAEARACIESGHSTRVRARQLRDAIEGYLGRAAAEPRSSRPASPPPSAEARAEKRRWLFFVGDEPSTVERRTYAERLAWDLATRQHEVVIARVRRGALPTPPRRPGGPEILELPLGPVPLASSRLNRELAASGPLLARLARAVSARGPFDGLVAEAALGALVVCPLAERLGRPFILCLDGSEVAKRKNRLTRDQLYRAELEHWGCSRADEVLVPFEQDVRSVGEHYGGTRVRWAPRPVARLETPADSERLVRSVGLEPQCFIAVLAEGTSERERRAWLEGRPGDRAVVLLTHRDVWVRADSRRIAAVSRVPAVGRVLACLLVDATAVVALDARDPRLEEAIVLGAKVAVMSEGCHEDSKDLDQVATAARRRALDAASDAPALERIFCGSPRPRTQNSPKDAVHALR